MSTDPRFIITLLHDLAVSIDRLNHDMRQLEAGGTHLLVHCREQVHQFGRAARARAEETHREESTCAAQVLAASKTLQRAQSQLVASEASRQQALAVRHAATNACAHWTAEVNRAKQAVARADAKVARAESVLEAAEHEYDRAVRALHEAEAELSACQEPTTTRDSQGNTRTAYRDCSSYRHAVARAQSRVEEGARRVAMAQAELERALDLLDAALRHLAHCERCLEIARRALQVAQEATVRAEAGCVEARNAVALATDCATLAESALDVARRAVQLCDEALHLHRLAEGAMSEATVHVPRFRTVITSASGLGFDAVRLIQDRVELLTLFNRPSGMGRP